MSVNSDAICGNCGYSFRNHKNGFCHKWSMRHRFTDQPTALILGEWIETKPELHQQLVSQWRKENGHE